MPTTKKTGARGYGNAHQKKRAAYARDLARAGTLPCARCHLPIHHGDQWDLGHTDDRSGYQGIEHVACNRSAGGRNGAKKTNSTKANATIREW